MDRFRHVLGGMALLAGLLLLPGAARAQEVYNFSAAALGSIGGSLDADPGDDLGNTGYQLNLSMVTDYSALGLDGVFQKPVAAATLLGVLKSRLSLPEAPSAR